MKSSSTTYSSSTRISEGLRLVQEDQYTMIGYYPGVYKAEMKVLLWNLEERVAHLVLNPIHSLSGIVR